MKIPGYRVHRKIGRGGMASVYLATQEAFERKVAIKIIANKALGDSQNAERFQREAKIIAGLSHPHIVPVYDVGSIDEFQYLAMEYLPGGDLSSWIRSGLEPNESIQILIQLAKALHFAHAKGYIHRDVKPDNILFREDGSAVLTDFGIARPRQGESGMTRAGKVLGTPLYMSPEQAQDHEVDGRTDLYALGVIFYQMLTRSLPYQSDDPLAVALMHIKDPFPSLPPKYQLYEEILNGLIAKSPSDRYENGLALSKALQHLLDKTPRDASNIKAAPEPLADLKLSDTLTSSLSSQQSLKIEYRPLRKLGIFKRSEFYAYIRSREHHHFNILFDRISSDLLEWHEQQGKRCAVVSLEFDLSDEMIERAKERVGQIQQSQGPYTFLSQLEINLQFTK